ncbi:MAG: hypothetical protein WEB90_02620 [Gemmatimonadota bacterium]
MRPLGTVAFAAISGVVLWQLFATLFLPLLGVLIGLVVTTVKIAMVVAVGFFVYSLIKKRREQAEA